MQIQFKFINFAPKVCNFKRIKEIMKKLFIETYGCQMNVADSEVVASVMQMAGYELCEKEDDADAIFLNTLNTSTSCNGS